MVKDENGESAFRESPDYDLAVTGMHVDVLGRQGAEFGWFPDDSVFDLARIERKGIVGGDGVFVLGFPMGFAGTLRKYAIVRGGVLARVDQELVDEEKCVPDPLPRVSGEQWRPGAILRPEVASVQGTTALGRSVLIGVVSEYVA